MAFTKGVNNEKLRVEFTLTDPEDDTLTCGVGIKVG